MRRVLTIALLFFGACGDDDAETTTQPPEETRTLPSPDLRVAIITDLKGYLAPCGCTSRPLGGIDRMAARVAALEPDLLLTAGDLLFGNEHHAGPSAETTEVWRAETLVDVLETMGADAATPGALDLRHGEDVFARLAGSADFPFLAAGVDLVGDEATNGEATNGEATNGEATNGEATNGEATNGEATNGEANGEATNGETTDESTTTHGPPSVLAAHHVFERDELRIAVLGLSDMRGASPSALLEAAEAGVAATEADLRIALVRADRRISRDVAAVEGIDLVVQAGLDREDAIPPSKGAHAWLVHGGRQGQGVLVVDLYRPGAEGELADVSAWSVDAERALLEDEIASLERRLEEWRAEGRAESELATQQRRLERMQRERDELRPPPLPDAGPAFAARWEALEPEADRDPRIREQLAAFDRRVNEHNRVALADRTPPPADGPHYVGSTSCGSCHEAALSWWQEHPHGNAYATLVERDKQFHLDCVGCHVTGYERPGGSTVTHLGDGGVLRDVGCENCHGPGSAHVEDPSAPMQRDAPEQLCTGCHNEEHSDQFVYDAYRTTLLVPGHGRPANGGPE